MAEGLVLSLISLGCLCGGGGMIFLSDRKVAILRRIGAAPDAERVWNVLKYIGGWICCIAMGLIIIALNNPNVYS